MFARTVFTFGLTGLKNENVPDEILKVNLLKGEVINIKSLRRWNTFGSFNFYHDRWKWEAKQILTIF